MSLGKLTGPAGAAATVAGLATSTAKIVALQAGKSRLANTIAVKSFFILQLPSPYSYLAYRFGSKASRTDSPMKTTRINVMEMAPNGAKVSHNLSRFSGSSAWSISWPQLGVGGGNP